MCRIFYVDPVTTVGLETWVVCKLHDSPVPIHDESIDDCLLGLGELLNDGSKDGLGCDHFLVNNKIDGCGAGDDAGILEKREDKRTLSIVEVREIGRVNGHRRGEPAQKLPSCDVMGLDQ